MLLTQARLCSHVRERSSLQNAHYPNRKHLLVAIGPILLVSLFECRPNGPVVMALVAIPIFSFVSDVGSTLRYLLHSRVLVTNGIKISRRYFSCGRSKDCCVTDSLEI